MPSYLTLNLIKHLPYHERARVVQLSWVFARHHAGQFDTLERIRAESNPFKENRCTCQILTYVYGLKCHF